MAEQAAGDITAAGSAGFDLASGFLGVLRAADEKVGDLASLPASAAPVLFENVVSLII